MDEFVRELKESAAGLHDGMGGHADHCSLLMKKAAKHIAELEENATAQALALKAAKAMQQAETERADANGRDAERHRWMMQQGWLQNACDGFDTDDVVMRQEFEKLVNENIDQQIAAKVIANQSASRIAKPDLEVLRAISDGEDLPNGK